MDVGGIRAEEKKSLSAQGKLKKSEKEKPKSAPKKCAVQKRLDMSLVNGLRYTYNSNG